MLQVNQMAIYQKRKRARTNKQLCRTKRFVQIYVFLSLYLFGHTFEKPFGKATFLEETTTIFVFENYFCERVLYSSMLIVYFMYLFNYRDKHKNYQSDHAKNDGKAKFFIVISPN
jgi:hypothetical protein